MKVMLVAINAKYIHQNNAIRLLKANTTYPVELKDFTIKDDYEKMLNEIKQSDADLIGFSTYIWNVRTIEKLVYDLKKDTKAKILLGGPEVSYDIDFFFNWPIDFLISGEGELSFDLLLDSLINNKPLENVPSLSFRKDNKIITNFCALPDLKKLNLPYYFIEDKDSIQNKIAYIESSRGCPYKCSYCLSSLEKYVRFFPLEEVKKAILYLINQGVKTFKFLDRTFNADKKRAKEIFDFIIDNYKENNSFQFEITLDVFPKELIIYLNENSPRHLFRFEVGIQSLNKTANLAIDRIQNNQTLLENIKLIKDADIIDLHLDLIAGLPYDTKESFKDTFNQVFNLKCKELQLGFLKMLRGTKIRNEKNKYDYIYDELPPYEIVSNMFITKDELDEIRLVSRMLEIFWNKGYMNETISYIVDNINPYDMFLSLSKYQKTISYHLIDLFINVQTFIKEEHSELLYNVENHLRLDYLKINKYKPKIWWKNNSNKNDLLRTFSMINQDFSLETLYRNGHVYEYFDQYIIVIYKNNKNYLYFMNK